MRRQVQECKGVNSIGWIGPSGYVDTNAVEIIGMRTPSDKDVPQRFNELVTSLFRHWGEKIPVGSV
jgi:hypothetical protein